MCCKIDTFMRALTSITITEIIQTFSFCHKYIKISTFFRLIIVIFYQFNDNKNIISLKIYIIIILSFSIDSILRILFIIKACNHINCFFK